jgi:hypothetical protein
MRIACKLFVTIAITGLLSAPQIFLSQNVSAAEPHVPLQKTIGQGKSQVVPSLIVMHSRSATLEGNTLTLTDVGPNSIVFADRPVRAAGHALTVHLLEEWNPDNASSDSFANDPPNATVSAFSKDGSEIYDAVVVLKSPKMDGDNLTFDVAVLEGDLTGADGPASIFIDRIGRPLTPLSFAGAARRTARRSAWYAGAAAGSAAYPRCGYYPYPPCY